MNLVNLALRRPWTVVAVVLAAALGAGVAVQRMARDVFPALGIPTLYVAQPYGGMDPAQMEGFLTYYYEYHFLYITGIEHVESKSIQGAALIKLQFHPGMDMAQAMAETVGYVNRARAFMPPGTVPPFIMRFDAGSVPVGNLVFSSETRTVGEMQDAALNLVRPLFATLPGVSAPPPFGGSARSIVVNAKPDRLRACKLSPDDLVSAIASANLISPSGNLALGGKYPMVPLNATVKNIHDLEAVPIRTGTYPAVFLRDVATVTDASDLVTSYALINGKRTVYIPVTKRADASTLSVVNLVKQNLAKLQSVLPSDVKVGYEFDQSPYVTRAIAGLTLEGALGAELTGLMILLFLRDWRSAFVVVVNIPLALMSALLALWLTGQTVNLMTLGGLALAVGILVDESTVCLESIHAHLARGKSLARAALDASNETAGPRFLSMLCILALFTPALFMTGAAKAMFLPLSLAVGFSMVASFLLSSSLVPILSIWFLRGHERADKTAAQGPGAFARFQKGYAGLTGRLLRIRRGLVPVYLGGAAALLFFVGRRTGTEIFPSVETGQLQLRIRAPAGTQVAGTEALALQVLELIKKEAGPENIQVTLGLVGVHAPNYPINLIHLWNGGPEEGVLQVQLKKGAPIVIEELKERLRRKFAALMPGSTFSFEPGDIVSRVMSLGAPTPIEVAISGPNLGADREFAEKVKNKLQTLTGLRDIQFGQTLDYPTVEVAVDRERAGLMGLKMAEVSRSLVTATASSRFVTPVYWADPVSGVAYQIQVQIPQAAMNSSEQVRNLPVGSRNGQSILLRDVARLTEGTAVGQYERYNMQRLITVTANLNGADLGSVSRQVEQALLSLGTPPPKVSVTLRGQTVPLRQLLEGLSTGLLVAIVLILLLLAAHFQSLKLSLVVLSPIPAVLTGVVLTLKLTGTTLNLESFMGAIMAVGVAVANAILMVTAAESSRLAGNDAPTAALDGAQSRLRPILMTSLAMIAGMLPLALGLSEGSQQSAPLGRAVVGGLTLATLATLLVLPAVFALIQAGAHRRSASLDPEDRTGSCYELNGRAA